MDAKKIAAYLLKEMNLQTLSQEYAGAIIDLCEAVENELSAEHAYCFGFLMGVQHTDPKKAVHVMADHLKVDWQKFKESFS